MTLEQLNLNLTNQIVNYIVVDEFLKDRHRFASNALCRLVSQYGMTKVPSKLTDSLLNTKYTKYIKNQLSTGTRSPDFPTVFNDVVGPRYNKDLIYKKFSTLLDLFIPDPEDRIYCGLPAIQLGMIRKELQLQEMDVCELDKQRFAWIESFRKYFLKRETGIYLHRENIFNVLARHKNNINIIDLDLMCTVDSLMQLSVLAELLYRATRQGKSVISLTTCIGRSISELEYNALMPTALVERLRSSGFKNIEVLRDRYRDRMTPMRNEMFVLTK